LRFVVTRRRRRVFLMARKAAKAGKKRRSAPRSCGKGSKGVVNSGKYVVPGNEVADEDLEFDFLDWPSCERSRGLDVRLSVRTRILLACHATDHLDKSVLIESWERSGLIPFDPSRVLRTLADDEDGGAERRKSGRVKSKEAANQICQLAQQFEAGDIDEQQLIIGVKKLADDAVCFHVTESTGAAAAKGVRSGAIPSGWGSKPRKTSKSDDRRSGSFQGDEYDVIGQRLDEEADALNRQQPWECKVLEKKKECGHRLKSVAGLTKHATTKHHGIGKYYNHLTEEIKTFVVGEAAAAAAVASPPPAAAAAAAAVASPPPAAAAAAAAGVAVDSSAKRVKCRCGGFYTAATIGKHVKKKRHTLFVADTMLEADEVLDED
jgi:hypothetical protein